MSRETKILHALLVFCLGLGFISLTLIYLPQISVSRLKPKLPSVPPKELSEVVPPEIPKKPEPAVAPIKIPESVVPSQTEIAPTADAVPVEEPASQLKPATAPLTLIHKPSSLAAKNPLKTAPAKADSAWWQVPPVLKANVEFWKKIYTEYSTDQVVLHDSKYLNIVYQVLDFSEIRSISPIKLEKIIEDEIEQARKIIQTELKNLSQNPNPPYSSALAETIAGLFEDIRSADSQKYLSAVERVRAQTGQQDKFLTGLKNSGRYLGEIESIFQSYHLPRELTRLIFVESMFDLKAHSSSNAVGIWQFIPATGRRYLKINSLIDERLDPIRASHGAARLMRDNYEKLGGWPLAVNAYNTGPGRILDAVRQTGSRDIGVIVKTYAHPAYAFASRNFYAEFLAALDVAENSALYFGKIPYDPPLRFDLVKLPYHISLPKTVALAGLSIETLAELNPSFKKDILTGRRFLPLGAEIRVPENQGQIFIQSASRAEHSSTGKLTHLVAPGEDFSEILELYDLTRRQLEQANPILKKQHHLRVGQKLVIPVGR